MQPSGGGKMVCMKLPFPIVYRVCCLSVGNEGEEARMTPRLLGGRFEVQVTEGCGGMCACACVGGGACTHGHACMCAGQ